MKSFQIWNFTWTVFFRIRSKYGDLQSKFLYLVKMQKNTDQKSTPNPDPFHAVIKEWNILSEARSVNSNCLKNSFRVLVQTKV